EAPSKALLRANALLDVGSGLEHLRAAFQNHRSVSLFDQIRVCSCAEFACAVKLFTFVGEQHQGDVGQGNVALDVAAEPEAVETVQRHVGDDQIGVPTLSDV